MRQAQLPKHPVSTKLSQLASLSGSVAVAVLRHAALQRHVGMNADPAFVVVSGKNDGRPTWPIEAAAMVLPPFLTGFARRIYAANFSFWAGVMPPMPALIGLEPMVPQLALGRSLL